MKICIKDFNYRGVHFESYEFDMPNVKNLDEVPSGKIEEYVIDSIENTLDWNESFGLKGLG